MDQEAFLAVQPPPSAGTDIDNLLTNYAENKEILEKATKALREAWSNVNDRSEVEEIWEKNDEMYRVKPDAAKDSKHRANESTGVYHVSVNQLVAIAYKTFTDNPETYYYGYTSDYADPSANAVRQKNAAILTKLLRKAQAQARFKQSLKHILHDCYKYGNCFGGLLWEKRLVELDFRDKESGQRRTKTLQSSDLPLLVPIPIDRVYLDENIDSIEDQPAIFIRDPIGWIRFKDDVDKGKFYINPDDGSTLKETAQRHRETVTSEYTTPQSDRMDNADRSMQERSTGIFKHWYIWINLPIKMQTAQWDENGQEKRFRIRILGDPDNGIVGEIRANMFPGGVPVLVGHQSVDDIGIYHISLGEKIETYFDQICVATDQLMDNRSKNTRRPIFYDPLRVDIANYDFGHGQGIPVNGGDPRTALYEAQLADMTGTIMATIQYCELKVRELMNTTDAVMGMAMGGRTSASEYMGAKIAATTPIFADLSTIEDAIMGEYMRRFMQYIHTFLTPQDLIALIGPEGLEFQFDLNDIYTVECRGVTEARDKAIMVQNLLQLYGLTTDTNKRDKILLRVAKLMEVENAEELVPIPATDQAIKAALWENNEMLIYGQWDEPELGEMHDVHIPIHRQAEWQARQDKNPNIQLLTQHIAATEQLKRKEQVPVGNTPLAGASSGLPMSPQDVPPTPGQLEGQNNISAEMGGIQAGSPVPQTMAV